MYLKIVIVILLLIVLYLISQVPFQADINQSSGISHQPLAVNSQPWVAAISLPIIPPNIKAKAAIIFDLQANRILFEKNISQPLPIASLTKLMTAVVALENHKDIDLLYPMLIESDNEAALELGEGLVEAMNQKSQEIGLAGTYFVEPTGLDKDNISTIYDLVLLTKYSFNHPLIWDILSLKEYDNLKNTNELLELEGVKGGKTGYTEEAGDCLILVKDDIVYLVLNAQERFEETKKLINWYEHY